MIRIVNDKDVEELLNIYSYYVKNTAISFEYDVPSQEEFTNRIRSIKDKYPYLVYEENGKIVGYAYATYFKTRRAYDHSVEVSIYVDREYHGRGIGSALYEALEKILVLQNILNMYAVVTYPDVEDEYLTMHSRHFHEHLGFKVVGEFHKCGNKFGRWYNMVYLEKCIGEHDVPVLPVVTFENIIHKVDLK
ncbi:MAG: N-acetyltransferase [Erysipelotrichaceae bacterium]|nr:N-acetyltransferase [Erysipelotrichaceae bacterium]